MWLETPAVKEDLEYIASADYIPWDKMMNKTFLITGATGLIGSSMINALLFASFRKNLNIKVLAVVRDIEKAEQQFGEQLKTGILSFVRAEVENLTHIEGSIDYIIHGASPTASTYFINNPVETVKTSVLGTVNLMELAREKCVEGFAYLSSMEVYGMVKSEAPLKESMVGFIDPVKTRSSYPESKRMCETIAHAYAKEYGVKTAIIRLAQSFGPGIVYNDERVFAMMARCVLEGRDILLQTTGTSKRSYLYTAQAVTAILTVLMKGEMGEAYNAANPDTYCSIYEMGKMVTEELGDGKIQVKTLQSGTVEHFSPPHCLNLDIEKIRQLGWRPIGNLKWMYQRMLSTMSTTRHHVSF